MRKNYCKLAIQNVDIFTIDFVIANKELNLHAVSMFVSKALPANSSVRYEGRIYMKQTIFYDLMKHL